MPKKSYVWQHFTRVTGEHGKFVNEGKCNYCSKVLKTKDGTTNMWKHLRTYHPQEAAAADGAATTAHCREEAIRDLAQMIAFHGYDPSVVEDDHFRNFVRRLNPEFKLPSRENIEVMCDDVFTQSTVRIRSIIWSQRAIRRHSFAVGTTKSMETREALYITCHFVDDEWNLHRVVDHAYMVLPPGDYYNKQFTLLGVPMVSCEVASELAMSYIANYIDFNYDTFVITGEITGNFGHLELQRCMKQQFDIEVTCNTYMDHVLHSIARCLLLDSNIVEDIFSNLNDLEWTRRHHQKFLLDLDLDDPWEYNECWYWCYCSLKILIHKHQRVLTQSEILLFHRWGDIYGAIKRVSACSTPTSNLCLEELFKVRSALVLRPHQQSGAPIAAHVPLRKALETVDKAIEDWYLVWSIPLVLDPRYKLRHIEEEFKNVFDDAKAAEYTSKVTKEIKKLYNSYIGNFDDDSDEEMMTVNNTSPEDQLDHYLEDSPARTTKDFDFDILNWWKVRGSVKYPMVAEMAKDALAMPTCSKLTCDQIAQIKSFIRGYWQESDR